MWRVPVFFCACGGRVPVFWFWGCFFVRVVSLIENIVSFRGKKMRNLRSPLFIVVAAQNFKLSKFDFTFSDNTRDAVFFDLVVVVCLLFVVVVVVCCWCWCCFYYCVVTSFFLHFWLKPTPSLLLQKSHARAQKKNRHTPHN